MDPSTVLGVCPASLPRMSGKCLTLSHDLPTPRESAARAKAREDGSVGSEILGTISADDGSDARLDKVLAARRAARFFDSSTRFPMLQCDFSIFHRDFSIFEFKNAILRYLTGNPRDHRGRRRLRCQAGQGAPAAKLQGRTAECTGVVAGSDLLSRP